MELSDSEIIQKVLKGEKNRYSYIIDRYKDRALTLAISILKNREEAEEAAQDAFIRAYNALDKFEGKSRFGTWFYRILYNVCLTRIGRKKEDFFNLSSEDDLSWRGWAGSGDDSALANFEVRDLLAFVRKILKTLPDKYQTIISLFYFQNLSHEEISEITQLPIGTVKTHLHRARAMLQSKLQKELQIEKAI